MTRSWEELALEVVVASDAARLTRRRQVLGCAICFVDHTANGAWLSPDCEVHRPLVERYEEEDRRRRHFQRTRDNRRLN